MLSLEARKTVVQALVSSAVLVFNVKVKVSFRVRVSLSSFWADKNILAGDVFRFSEPVDGF